MDIDIDSEEFLISSWFVFLSFELVEIGLL